MKTRNVAAVSTLLVVWSLSGCGDDGHDVSPGDAGPVAGEEGGGSGGKGGSGVSGKGGSGGKGGVGGGGSGGTAGKQQAGEGGSAGTSEQGGKGGSGGSSGAGGSAPAKTYAVGGTVSGLSGSGLKLKNNGGDELTVGNNGAYSFGTKLATGADYAVTVSAQPGNPMQTCTIAAASGKVASANVTNINVTCSTDTHKVGGMVSGLGGGTIALKNNGGDLLTLTTDGSFNFTEKVASGSAYAVTVETLPTGRTCSVDHGSGSIGTGDITDVVVACYANLNLLAQPRVGSVGLSWTSNGATSYSARVSSNPNCDFDADVTTCTDGAEQTNVTSPYVWSGLTNGKVYYFQVRGAHPANFITRSDKPGVRPNRAQFDGPVLATAIGDNGTAYVGGSFSNIGPFSGFAVPLDGATGLPTRMPNYPIANNAVTALVSDGNNGYFVGGSFTTLGGANRKGLAHVSSDGTVDANWDPDLGNGGSNVGVSALALVGTTLYVGGVFTSINTNATLAARAGLGAVSTTGMGMATGFNPAPNGRVTTLATDGTTLYVGGEFTMISGTGRSRLAAYTESTGTLLPNWHPDPDGDVAQILLDGVRLYVAGFFGNIASTMRFGLVALTAADGTLITAFAPAPNMGVTSIAVTPAPSPQPSIGATLYAAGQFTTIGGQPRGGLAALVTADGSAQTGWNPAPDHAVNVVVATATTVYAGGDFTMIGGMARNRLAALSVDTGMANSWNPKPDGSINNIFKFGQFGETIYVSGDINMVGAESRSKLASFNNGSLTTWAPEAKNGDVSALAFSGGTVYAGGSFDAIGTATRQGVAAIDGTGAATAWDAQLSNNGSVSAIALDNTHVYIGGSFTAAGGGARANLAGLNTSDGNLSNWTTINTDGTVRALAVSSGGTVYLGGEFLNVGGTGRQRLAAISSAGTLVPGWNPGASATVHALALDSTNVYIGGEFSTLGGMTRNRLGAVAVGATSTLDSWDPNLDDVVNALALNGSFLYAGGDFSMVGTAGKARVVQFDTGASDNNPTAWNRNVNGEVDALAADANNVYIGGDFSQVAGNNVSNFVKELPTQ